MPKKADTRPDFRSGGDGIWATFPIQPDFIGNRKNVNSITAGIDGVKEDERTKTVYETVTTEIMNGTTKTMDTREVFFTFPPAITCNNKAFNNDENGLPPADDYHLKTTIAMDMTKVVLGDVSDKTVYVSLKSNIVWEVVVDEKSRPTELDVGIKKDLSGAFAKMKLAATKKRGF